MNAKTVFLSTALAAALATASAAHAADAKVYPGSACQAYRGYEAGELLHAELYLLNNSLNDRNVICPIVWDRTGNTNGVIGADVRVQSNVHGDSLTCYLFSHRALGELVAYGSATTTSQNINVLPLDIDISTNGGTYILRCVLPRGGRIYGYSVNEY